MMEDRFDVILRNKANLAPDPAALLDYPDPTRPLAATEGPSPNVNLSLTSGVSRALAVWQRACRGAGLIGLALIIILSLVPGSSRPKTGAPGDLEHLLAYCLTAMALALGWPSRTHRVVVVAGLLGLAALLEILQLWVPGRNSDLGAALMSGIGGAIGVSLAYGLTILAMALKLGGK